MIVHQERKPPGPLRTYCGTGRPTLLKPLYFLDWLLAWFAHILSRWVLLEVLEYLGTFSVLVAVVFYFAESGDRIKQKHYQAWQVINTAQGKGGSGGRIEALQELNADGVPLVGIDLTDAFLQGVQLPRGQLLRSRFGSADLRESSFASANLAYSSFNTANLRGANFHKANLSWADFTDADLSTANLTQAGVQGTRFDRADLRYTDWKDVRWQGILSVRLADLFGAKNLPPDFSQWATRHGAVFLSSDDQWNALQNPAKK
jgi:Pentapeptide repeats (9 copies)